jgi:hypothetical protein
MAARPRALGGDGAREPHRDILTARAFLREVERNGHGSLAPRELASEMTL